VEGALKQVPENPPLPLYEANQIITAAENFWGLEVGSIRGRSRKFHIVWPRFTVCSILRRKGYTYTAIGEVLNRDHGAAHNAVSQFDAITSAYAKYREQAVQFDRYLWKKQTANSREGYRSVAVNR
jgi:chromosomal replication initiation ATPase DnaA